jgi:hypothetical protein
MRGLKITYSDEVLTRGAGADVGGEEYVAQAVDIEIFEVVFGEVEFESAFEVSDASFKLVSVEGCD